MKAPKSNVSSWAAVGRAASKAVIENYDIARKYSPDPTTFALAGMKARAEEKTAAMKADYKVNEAKENAEALKNITKEKVDTYNTLQSAKKQAKMGANFAKAGSLLGAGLAKDDTPPPTDYSAIRSLYEKRGAQLEADEASFTPYERTIDPETQKPIERATTPRNGTPLAGALPAAGIEDKIEPAASQQTSSIAAGAGATLLASKNKPSGSSTVSSMGFTDKDFQIYKDTVANIESGGKYNILGGSNDHYDGKYQMGAAAKTDAARILGIDDPGHTSGARANFRNSPQLQESMFEGYTKANHNFLMGNPKYANSSPQRKLEILGYAHNQGMGGANKWLNTGKIGNDGFGTPGTRYSTSIRSAFEGL